MKFNIQKCLTAIFIIVVFSSIGCKKEFLEKKPNTGIVVPVTLSDMMQLLDNDEIFKISPVLGIISADEYYYTSIDNYNSRVTKTERNAFIWKPDIYGGETKIVDWEGPYQCVFYSNVVLEQYEKLSEADQTSIQGKYIKAWALFCRSYSLYNLVQLFSPAYNSATATEDLGIPLKITANINDVQKRSTVQETYDKIITDLESSISLYTDVFPDKNLNRSSKEAVYALLARIYLSMGKYPEALMNAENCLKLKGDLIDYNTLNTTDPYPFPKSNNEIIYFTVSNYTFSTAVVGISANATLDPTLITLFEPADLRKEIFFKIANGNFYMKCSYAWTNSWQLTGLAVDEIYLIKAECLARIGNYNDGMDVLNALLIKRYKFDVVANKSLYINQTASSSGEALQKILLERRKELVWRGLRWSDLKRLNAAGANITLTRNLDGKIYTLPPNDPRYVLPIPDDEIALSHIQQNIR